MPESRLESISDAQLADLQRTYPGIPEHYLSFLRHVGYGMLGDSCFALYSGPYEPAKIFDRKTAEALAGILFFGDNFAGWMVGFDTRSHWRIVGMGSHDRQPRPQSASTVGEFIAQEIVGLTTDRTGGENRP